MPVVPKPPASPDAQRRRRLMIAAAAGGVLALVFLLSRRAGGGRPAAQDPNAATQTGAPGTPSTFADNGGQAAQLGNDVTSAVGQVGTAMMGFQSSIDSLSAQIAGMQATAIQPATDTGQPAVATADPASPGIVINVGAPPTARTVAGRRSAGAPAGKPGGAKHAAPAHSTHNVATKTSGQAHLPPGGQTPVHHKSPATPAHKKHH